MGTVNDLTIKNQFGEEFICQLVDSAAGIVLQSSATVTVASGAAAGMVLGFVKTGSIVNVAIHNFAFTGANASLAATITFPTGMTPANLNSNTTPLRIPVYVNDGTNAQCGELVINSTSLTFYIANGANFPNTASCIIYPQTIAYAV